MTRIDFYVAQPSSPLDRYQLACRVANKAYQAKHHVLMHAPEVEMAQHLDRLLWTWHDISFIPHGLLGQADPALNPILIGDVSAVESMETSDILINLVPTVPLFFSRFNRLIECVDQEATSKQQSRERYRFYRDRGYPLQMHQIT